MVKSADRAIDILEAVGDAREGLTHAEIAAKLNIPKSSLSALLVNLVKRQYLAFHEEGKRYSLGPQLLVLAGRYRAGLDVVSLGQPFLRQVTIDTQESSALAVLNQRYQIIVGRENSPQSLMRAMQIGERNHLYATAAGKALLAHRSEEEINTYLGSVEMIPVTKYTLTSPEALRLELKNIRNGAIAYSRQELQEGIVAMAAPIFDFTEVAIAAIVVGIPSVRFDEKKEKCVEESLRYLTAKFSRQLGYDG
ncbi:MAG: IclR family transcriptional regulator [Proteobacteria bacterium]|nr:IclR family transcriptional regulator [Pseudomonadota bacterium]